MVDGQKMSESQGNFYTLRDVLGKGYSGREVRYALMRVHYRAQGSNFTWEGMEESTRGACAGSTKYADAAKSREADGRLSTTKVAPPLEDLRQLWTTISIFRARWESCLMEFVTVIVRSTNRFLTVPPPAQWLQWWSSIDRVLAITGARESVPDEIP